MGGESAMLERTGLQLGNYRLVQVIGQGGFADVYLGEHVYLNTQAAIKVLRTQLDQNDMSGFLGEARTIASLRHLHIVRVLDFGVENTTPFLVMDYAPKGTLRRLYPKGTQLPLQVIIPSIKQVADALQYAHDQHFIHRDIKPENMLIGSNDEVLLSDFGIATMTQSTQHQTQSIVGTVAYMAPEQVQGKPRAASDQYALAVIAYEWLTGACPFLGSFTEIAAQQMYAPPPPIRALLPGISPDIEQVIMIALAKDPDRRFASVQAFAHALEQASGGEETLHVPYAPSYPATPYPPTIPAVPYNTPAGPITPPAYTHTPPPVSSPFIAPSPGEFPSSPAQQLPLAAPAEKQISRRFFLYAGLGTAALAVAGIAAWAYSRQSFSPGPITHATPTSGSTATAAPPTQAPSATSEPPTQAPTTEPYVQTIAVYNGPDQMYTASWQPPNGSYIASGGKGANIEVWQPNNASNPTTYTTPAQKVFHVAWSHNGRYIAAVMDLGYIQIWDTASGNTVFSQQAHNNKYVNCVAWSPDDSQIVTGGGDNTAIVWNVAGQSQLVQYTGHSNHVNAVAWSHNGDRIVSGSDDMTAQVWNAANGSPLLRYTNHSNFVLALAWGPGDGRIASASDDHTVQVWNSASGTRAVMYTGHSNIVVAMDWSPDGTLIASGGGDTTVQVWDAATGQRQRTYRGHTSQIEGIAWSPDSANVASAGDDGMVRVWPGR